MATGSSDARERPATSGALADALAEESPLTITAAPTVRHVVAAAALASAASAPHIRVVGADRPAVGAADGPTVTTAPGIATADIELSPYTPLADVEAVVEKSALPRTTEQAIMALRRVGADPHPGIVATHDDLKAAFDHSVRLPTTIELDRLPEAPVSALDEETARTLASTLAVQVAAGDTTKVAAVATAHALGPTPVEDAGAPTAEGVTDLIAVTAAADPSRAIVGLLSDDWSTIKAAYESAVAAIDEAVAGCPTGADTEIAVAEVTDAPAVATARRWATEGLDADYGVVIRGEQPTIIGLIAAGDRAASAVMETVSSRLGGASWGGPFAAGAVVPERPADPIRLITEAL